MRESDGTHFLWNGEGCVRVSPIAGYYKVSGLIEAVDSPRWHDEYGRCVESEINLLNDTMNSRARGFTILGHGRYKVIARGEFKNSE